MGATPLKRFFSGAVPKFSLFAVLLAALYFMSDATQNSERFGRLYSLMLLLNALGLVVLMGLIGVNLYRLVRQYHARAPGSRLTLRLVLTFVVLSVAPVTVVYYFSLQFLLRGIDSWFDVQVENALEAALDLSRSALDLRMRALLKETGEMASELVAVPDELAPLTLNDLRSRSGATELTLVAQNGRIVAYSSADPLVIVPDRPTDEILIQLRQGSTYVGLDPVRDSGLHARAVVPVPDARAGEEQHFLQALFPVTERVGAQADNVQVAFSRYKELAYLRRPLKYSFTLTLSLVLLLSLLSAVWAAFFAAQRLVAPIRRLAQGTQAVAAGNYGQQLPLSGRDELGFLVRSFNDMTRRIAQARDEAARSQRQVEDQRAYLEAVLGRLSSGVLTLERDYTLHTANAAATHILGLDLNAYVGSRLDRFPQEYPALSHFVGAILPHLDESPQHEWREEVTLFGGSGRQVLMCRGARLPDVGGMQGGHVIVFDDITNLIQAQRDAAWGEVARRLAHEIKNPLTPIQLSAERLRHKLLQKMAEPDAQMLDSATHTIVQQVEAMKRMVNAFSEYARAPQIQLEPLQFNTLVKEVVDLYRGHEGVEIILELDTGAPPIAADPGRLRQLLHNLVKNALEAMADRPGSRLALATQCLEESGYRFVEITIRDNGPGIPPSVAGLLFEPYVTTKVRGTGLGLAIVKKIVEEHGGVIAADNLPDGGARITIRLPVLAAERATAESVEHSAQPLPPARTL